MKNKVVVLVLVLAATMCMLPFILDIALRIQGAFSMEKWLWFLGGAGSAFATAAMLVAVLLNRQQG